jgi:hypothetical protein
VPIGEEKPLLMLRIKVRADPVGLSLLQVPLKVILLFSVVVLRISVNNKSLIVSEKTLDVTVVTVDGHTKP